MDEFRTMPGHLIRRLHQSSVALFAQECAGLDLTSVQYAALAAVGAHPGVDATRLSVLIAFDRSTIGDVLERLEGKGWILRTPSPQDRRIKVIRLSPEGVSLLQQVQPAVHRVQERLMAPLSAADRPVLLRLLSALASQETEEAEIPRQAAALR